MAAKPVWQFVVHNIYIIHHQQLIIRCAEVC
jgi:hypothetical protein